MAHVIHKDVPDAHQTQQHRDDFFRKGQPCLRSSALAKRYGWGFHFDDEGRVAMVATESSEYAEFLKDPNLRQLPAMRSRRASSGV